MIADRRIHLGLLLLSLAGCTQPASPLPDVPQTITTAPPNAKEFSPITQPTTATEPPVDSSSVSAGLEKPLEPEFLPEETDRGFAAEPDLPFAVEDGFTPLVFEDFEFFAAEPETWTPTGGDVLRCTGKPKGYLYSRKTFQNFTWRLEYRFEMTRSPKNEAEFQGNTGFLVYINGDHKRWPLCLEVQGKYADIGEIRPNGGAAAPSVQDDRSARLSARNPAGEWNRLEIKSRDGALTVTLNDQVVNRSEPNFLSDGKIGIQAEDYPFLVRRMRIREE